MFSGMPKMALPCLLAFAALTSAPPVEAQVDDEALNGLRFDFRVAGARALGRGGTFIASSDDATAAFTNPAGLFQLSSAEIAVEARHTRQTTPFVLRGRAQGTPTQLGVDRLGGLEMADFEDESRGLAHLSFAYPRPTWAVAAYYNHVADLEGCFRSDGIFVGSGSSSQRRPAAISALRMEIVEKGAALAYQRQGWQLGLAVSQFDLRLESITQRYRLPSLFAAPTFSAQTADGYTGLAGNVRAFGGTVGVLVKTGEFSIGVAFRANPEFEVGLLRATQAPGVAVPPRRVLVNRNFMLKMPNVFGLGFSHRLRKDFTISLDVIAVGYSQMLEGMITLYGRDPEDYVLEDVTELHAGIEYLALQLKIPIALRAGLWYDPDHRIRYEGDDPLEAATFFAGEDQLHATMGVGVTLGSHFQLDAAADYSERDQTASVSLIYRF